MNPAPPVTRISMGMRNLPWRRTPRASAFPPQTSRKKKNQGATAGKLGLPLLPSGPGGVCQAFIHSPWQTALEPGPNREGNEEILQFFSRRNAPKACQSGRVFPLVTECFSMAVNALASPGLENHRLPRTIPTVSYPPHSPFTCPSIFSYRVRRAAASFRRPEFCQQGEDSPPKTSRRIDAQTKTADGCRAG